jgi:hypothetical protein
MDFVNEMRQKAKSLQKRLVLAEGTEPRTIKAARIILDEKLAASVTWLNTWLFQTSLRDSVSWAMSSRIPAPTRNLVTVPTA